MKGAARRSRLLACFGLFIAIGLLAGPVPLASAAQRPPATPTPPAAPRPATQPVATEPSATAEQWVQNFEVTEQWSGPSEGAEFFGWLRKFSYLRVERSEADRYYVFNPRTNNFAWVNADVLGPSGAPPADYLEPLKVLASVNLPGRLIGRTDLYAEPVADDGVWLRTDGHNVSVFAVDKVQGDDGDWYRLDTGEFVSGAHLRLPGPPAAHYRGKWIDAHLSEPTLVTAYEGDRPVASALAIHGTQAWQTPVGTYSIIRRVANETMSSEGLGIPRNAPGGYYVQNVLFTQYFTGDGASIHYNYWSGNFGYAGSHGCLGMNYYDAMWFWTWADYGTPIVVHY